MTEHVVVMLVSVIVNADTCDEAVKRAQVPFLNGLLPNMGKILPVGVRKAMEGDRDPIVTRYEV